MAYRNDGLADASSSDSGAEDGEGAEDASPEKAQGQKKTEECQEKQSQQV